MIIRGQTPQPHGGPYSPSPDLVHGAIEQVDNSVTLPGALIDAARNGELVIFAGAGISRGQPAGYPDFEGLVDILTADAVLERRTGEQPDRYLGRVERQQGRRQMGEMARQYFFGTPRRPTPVHKALVQLFPSEESVRIVTTNYDELFELAGCGEPRYAAPALPRGNDFSGLVHIHGRAKDPHSRIVITDSDFGEAYLSEGWARDFIIELYRTHPVLFVGYSHNDVVVSYLARGIGSGPHPKYALVTDGAGGTDWEALGVTRIPYANPDGDHRLLAGALETWVAYAHRPEVEHERTLQGLIEKGPEDLDAAELSEVRRAIVNPDRIRYFTLHASGMPWIRWARSEGFLNPLVDKEDKHRLNVDELVLWIGRQVGSDYDRALRATLVEMGGPIIPALRWRIASYIRSGRGVTVEKLHIWSPALLQPPIEVDHLEPLFEKAIELDAPDVALSVLGVFLQLNISLRPDLWRGAFQREAGEPVPEEADREEVKSFADHRESTYGAYRAARWLLGRGDRRMAWRLAMMATTYLPYGHELYRTAGGVWDHGEDPWGYGVKEIGPFGREHDVPDDGEEFLVRLAVSAHEALRDLDVDAAEGLLKQWASSGYPILVRIALHLERQGGDPERVLEFVSSHPELFRWGASVEAARDAVVEHYNSVPPEAQERVREILLKEADDGFLWARDAAQQIRITVPEPDVDDLPEVEQPQAEEVDWAAVIGDDWVDVEEVRGLSVKDITGAHIPDLVDSLEVSFEERDNQPYRGLARNVADAAEVSPDWALGLAQYLADSERWESTVWRPLIWGVGNARTGAEHPQALVVKLAGWRINVALEEQAGLVEKAFWNPVDDDEVVRAAAAILSRVFGKRMGVERAVEALIRLVESIERAESTVDVSGVFDQLSGALEADEAACEAVGKHLWELHRVNRDWVEEHVFPLFDTAYAHPGADSVIRGVLSGDPRFLPAEVAVPVAEYLVLGPLDLAGPAALVSIFPADTECERAAEQLSDLERKAASVFERAALLAKEDPYPKWLGKFVSEASLVLRAHWTARVGAGLGQYPAAAEEMWTVWARAYVERRVAGLPKLLDKCEVRALFEWVAAVPEGDFNEAVALLERAPRSAPPDDRFIRRLVDSGLHDSNPDASTRLMTLALRSGAPVRWWPDRLREAVQAIAKHTPDSWPALVDELLLSGLVTAKEIEKWSEPSDPASSA